MPCCLGGPGGGRPRALLACVRRPLPGPPVRPGFGIVLGPDGGGGAAAPQLFSRLKKIFGPCPPRCSPECDNTLALASLAAGSEQKRCGVSDKIFDVRDSLIGRGRLPARARRSQTKAKKEMSLHAATKPQESLTRCELRIRRSFTGAGGSVCGGASPTTFPRMREWDRAGS